MASECLGVFVKILYRLFQLHLLLFVRTYALNLNSVSSSSCAGRASGCPIMRTKHFLHQHADILSRSFRLSALPRGFSQRSASSAAETLSSAISRKSNMMLFMSGQDSLFAAHQRQQNTFPLTLPVTNLPMSSLVSNPCLSETPRVSPRNYDLLDPTYYLSANAHAQLSAYSSSKSHAICDDSPSSCALPAASGDIYKPSHTLTSIAQYFELQESSKNGNAMSGEYVIDHKNADDASELGVLVIGLSHHNAGVDVREKLAIPEAEWRTVAQDLCKLPHVSEASVLSTCNRFELYVATSNQEAAIREIVDFLVARANNKNGRHADSHVNSAMDKTTLMNVLFVLNNEDAVWHLLRVAAGLDSLVVGEGQILSQVKKSYELCSLQPKNIVAEEISKDIEENKVVESAPAGKMLSKLLNTAVAAGKRARAETNIAKGAVSISSAAAQFTAQHVARDCRIQHIKDANICIIGSGKMARLLCVHLQTEGVRELTIVNRSPNRIEELRSEFPNLNIKFELMDKLWDVIADSDIVFPSTSSKTTIIDPEPLMQAMAHRQRPGGLQFIDISVPRNVHPDCSDIPGVYNYNVDTLKAAVDRNTLMRQREIVEVEILLSGELRRFSAWKQSLSAIPAITALQSLGENVRLAELAKILPSLSKKLDPSELKMIEKLTRSIVNKLLHGPMKMLRGHSNGNAKDAGLCENYDGDDGSLVDTTTLVKNIHNSFQFVV